MAALAHTYLLTLSSFLAPVSLPSRTHSHDRAALDCLTFHLCSHGRRWCDSTAIFSDDSQHVTSIHVQVLVEAGRSVKLSTTGLNFSLSPCEEVSDVLPTVFSMFIVTKSFMMEFFVEV